MGIRCLFNGEILRALFVFFVALFCAQGRALLVEEPASNAVLFSGPSEISRDWRMFQNKLSDCLRGLPDVSAKSHVGNYMLADVLIAEAITLSAYPLGIISYQDLPTDMIVTGASSITKNLLALDWDIRRNVRYSRLASFNSFRTAFDVGTYILNPRRTTYAGESLESATSKRALIGLGYSLLQPLWSVPAKDLFLGLECIQRNYMQSLLIKSLRLSFDVGQALAFYSVRQTFLPTD